MKDIVMEGLCKSFGDVPVLRGFSAVFPAGQVSCLMGPSGAGKTTLLRILLGLERPDVGSVSGLEGAACAAVFQEDRLCLWLTPAENLRLTNPALRREGVEEALRSFRLTDCDRPCGELSGGMRRRVSLLRALCSEAEALFLDEPFQGLDAETKRAAAAAALPRLAGKTVVLVTHDEAEAALLGARRVLRIPRLAG